MTERFTVYDIFAVLVPGVVFDLLLVLTIRRLTGVELFDWRGGFGDATVLAVVGYATGAALQALGDAITGADVWQRWRGGLASVEVLMPDSTHLSPGFKGAILRELEGRYGELPESGDPAYKRLLSEKVQRAYKQVRASDPVVDRFLAETHQMRAHGVGLVLLSLVAVGSIFAGSDRSCWEHVAWALGYGALAWFAFWRMGDKDRAFADHLWPRFAEPQSEATRADKV